MKLVDQGPGHVLHEIVVRVRARDVEVNVKHEGQRSRDDDLVHIKLGHRDYRVSPGLASEGLKVMRLTVRSAGIACSVFSLCEGSRFGGTAMVYIYIYIYMCL